MQRVHLGGWVFPPKAKDGVSLSGYQPVLGAAGMEDTSCRSLLDSEIHGVGMMASGKTVSSVRERGTNTYNTSQARLHFTRVKLCNCRTVQGFLLPLKETQSRVYLGWFMEFIGISNRVRVVCHKVKPVPW